ncbi:IPT/TIG domain-containing protein [Actinomadura sp. WMMA1423]|uniref:IPT/TIG domain-containing protein n=1 Tax=Actinomadura sp. WMMA1423 TaxID=2591108 RepID=UPI001146C3EE|nr:IPT/TIG domain-containing protein [Actinomadura sp. WMMA1423]
MAPVITSLSCGPQATNQGNAGQTLVITGTGLSGSTRVRFGTSGPQVTPSATTATSVTCTVPSGSGVVAVAVLNGGVWSNSLNFYYIPAPNACGLSPADGPATAPPAITITGNNLLTANQATFGAATPVTATATNDSAAQATPASITEVGASPYFQSVNATIRTAGGTTTVNGTYIAYDAPTITTVAPSSGPEGTEVLITGTGFVGPIITVLVDGNEAVATALSETQISAIIPAGTGTVDVAVTTAGGTATAVGAYTYT